VESCLHDRYQRIVINKRYTLSSWGKVISGVPQGSILGPLLFLLSIKYQPNIIKSKSIPTPFADDTSIIVMNPSHIDYENIFTQILKNIDEWFKASLLTSNLSKTQFMQFSTKKSDVMDMPNAYGNKWIASSTDIKFLGLIIDNTLSWKGHIDWLTSKLGLASYAIRTAKPYMSLETIRTIYFHIFIPL
jgi:hypothetical protein